jgi:hypothetical protein
MGWITEESGFELCHHKLVSFLSTVSNPALGLTQPPVQWLPRAVSPELKRSVRETHNSSQSNAIKNMWIYTTAPQYVFMVWCIVKYRDSNGRTLVVLFDNFCNTNKVFKYYTYCTEQDRVE